MEVQRNYENLKVRVRPTNIRTNLIKHSRGATPPPPCPGCQMLTRESTVTARGGLRLLVMEGEGGEGGRKDRMGWEVCKGRKEEKEEEER